MSSRRKDAGGGCRLMSLVMFAFAAVSVIGSPVLRRDLAGRLDGDLDDDVRHRVVVHRRKRTPRDGGAGRGGGDGRLH